jgi:hypothetical protein
MTDSEEIEGSLKETVNHDFIFHTSFMCTCECRYILHEIQKKNRGSEKCCVFVNKVDVKKSALSLPYRNLRETLLLPNQS